MNVTYLIKEVKIMNLWIRVAQLSVTIINEVITIMKDTQSGGK